MKYNLFVKGIVLLLSTILIATSCKKDNPPQEQLPPETHTGAYTFGCKVDGKIYTASGKGGLLSNQFVNYSFYSDTSIYISVGNTVSKFNLDLTIKYTGVLGLHYTSLYPYEGIFKDNSNGTIPGNSNTYNTNNSLRATVNIKYFNGSIIPLYSGAILSGTFEMDAINGNGKVIHITEGRFDIGH